MLDDLAYRFFLSDENTTNITSLAIMTSGMVVGIVTTARHKGELRRAPYFAFNWLVIAVLEVASYSWLLWADALAHGLFWVLAASQVLFTFASGFALGGLAAARSRDVYGKGYAGLLAVVPVLNLVLLFASPRQTSSVNRIVTPRLLSGGLGVVAGFLFIAIDVAIATHVSKLLQENWAANLESNPAAEYRLLDLRFRAAPLEETLAKLAAMTTKPRPVEGVLSFDRVIADGRRLTHIYIMPEDNHPLDDKFWRRIENTVCSIQYLSVLLRLGAEVQERYVRPDGSLIGEHVIRLENCPG